MGLNQSDTGKREFTENQPNANLCCSTFTQIFLRVDQTLRFKFLLNLHIFKILKIPNVLVYIHVCFNINIMF